MCGIAGRIGPDPTALERLEEASRRLAHRGPDDGGVERIGAAAPFAGLAHRRLSIIDLSAAARQPMRDGSGRRWIVFNGEIYNYRELRKSLEREGRRFRTSSDTEVILEAHALWGDACLERLDGMFAFAIWDDAAKRLFAARDRLGKKPFWYAQEPNGSIAFASEMRALLALCDVPREVDPEALAAYLVYQYVPPPRSILKGIRKLPPGHSLAWEKGAAAVRRWWEPRPAEGAPKGPREIAARVRETLAEAVRKRLVSDVPVGAFLSGGVDSTLAVALMRAATEKPIPTFSISFSERTHDESRYAALAARRFGTEHHAFTVDADAARLLPVLADRYGEPFGDSSAVPTFHLAREAAKHVKVVLAGDGGDELFLGYPRYKAVGRADRLDRCPPLRRAAGSLAGCGFLARGAEGSLRRQAWRFASHLSRDPVARYLGWVGIFHPGELPDLLAPDLAKRAGSPESFLTNAFAGAPKLDGFLARTACVDLATYLPNDLLVKVDIAAMASGLEVRSPFLDPALIELALSIPSALKIRGKAGKWILREACADLLPPKIRDRSKMGFGAPVGAWLKGELREMAQDLLSTSRVRRRGWLEPRTVRALLSDHLAGRRANGYRLWSLLFLETWATQFLDSSP